MALDGTYAGLLASIGEWLNRADLSALAPDLVSLCEARLNRALRVRRMVVISTASVSTEFATVPSDFGGLISLTLPDNTVLDNISTDAAAQSKWLASGAAGQPRSVAVVGGQFQFNPAPDDTYVMQLVYWQRIPPLATNPTSWCFAKNPDAYLYGALMQAAPYLMNDERIAVWGQLYQSAVSDIIAESLKEGFGAHLQPQPSWVI